MPAAVWLIGSGAQQSKHPEDPRNALNQIQIYRKRIAYRVVEEVLSISNAISSIGTYLPLLLYGWHESASRFLPSSFFFFIQR